MTAGRLVCDALGSAARTMPIAAGIKTVNNLREVET